MDYKYTQAGESYAPYAAGAVFYGTPGHTAFPVRLASELMRRCLAWRSRWGESRPAVVYDPCCGGAYHLATMAFLNWHDVAAIYASDIHADALSVAGRNLALLSGAGMRGRMEELSQLYQAYGKESHAMALQHGAALQGRLAALSERHVVETRLFCADALDPQAVAAGLAGVQVDIVLTDIPYGQETHWRVGDGAVSGVEDAVWRMLHALLPRLGAQAVVAMATAKHEKVQHAGYTRLEKLSAGRRQVVILRPRAGEIAESQFVG